MEGGRLAEGKKHISSYLHLFGTAVLNDLDGKRSEKVTSVAWHPETDNLLASGSSS